ncbi:ABC transporter permease [Aestuariivirga litoralis]|uniref:ABC transporter permease n=1 Tax=Aestuariivirga litoralis TaxID=2650924 RepID=UPI0018C48A5C|nr:ABC transporter permease [Aestuariivirga litoralis]MBG1233499.1 ABC transporter permease [Aestuariivirga litoralis]
MSHNQSDHIRQAVAARATRPLFTKISDWVRDKPEGGIAVMFVLVQVICIIGALIFPEEFRYLIPANIAVTLKSIAVPGIMALGVGVLMVAGEYDLSVGAQYSLLSIICADLSNYLGGDIAADPSNWWAPFLCLAIALALGTMIGIFHAFITLRFAIPSFITTLGGMLLWKGTTLLVHGASALRFKPNEPFATLFDSSVLQIGNVGVIHSSIIWFALFSVVFYFLLHHHKLGNHFYAVGGNRNAAVAIGINPARTKTIAFAIAGFMAAFSGVVAATRVGSIQPGGGLGMELQTIAACVIGGLALTGGRGSILGIVLGTCLVFTIQDVLLLLRAPAFYFDMFVGALIVIAVIMNTAIRRTKG